LKLSSDKVDGEEFELYPKAFLPGQETKIFRETASVGQVSKLTVR
jgi:hypothetical protein